MTTTTTDKITEPGRYDDVPDHIYHQDPCPEPSLSSSIGKKILEASPRHAWYAHPGLNAAWEESPYDSKKVVGQLCHKLLLGKGAEIERVDCEAWTRKADREVRDEALVERRIPCTNPQWSRANAVVKAAREQLPDFADMAAEVTLVSLDPLTGLWKRARTDLLLVTDDGALIVDYKTTEASAEPRVGAPRLMGNMNYDFQQAFYESVLLELHPELAGKIQTEFWIQEVKSEPYELTRIQLMEGDVDVARRKVTRATDTFSRCLSAGTALKDWPGYANRVHVAAMPSYHNFDWLSREMEDVGDAY